METIVPKYPYNYWDFFKLSIAESPVLYVIFGLIILGLLSLFLWVIFDYDSKKIFFRDIIPTFLFIMLLVHSGISVVTYIDADARMNNEWLKKEVVPYIDSLPVKRVEVVAYEQEGKPGGFNGYGSDKLYFELKNETKEQFIYKISILEEKIVEKQVAMEVTIDKNVKVPYLLYKEVPKINSFLEFDAGWYDAKLYVPENFNYKKWNGKNDEFKK